jgi:hypothetical protein
MLLTTLLGMAAIVICPAHNRCCARKAWASKKYEDQNQSNENGVGRACHVSNSL